MLSGWGIGVHVPRLCDINLLAHRADSLGMAGGLAWAAS